MATNATRQVAIAMTGDVVFNKTYAATANAAAPGDITPVRLAAGFNALTIPGAGTTVSGVTIIPPAGNTNALTLKGVTGDTGVLLHKTSPTSIGVDSTITQIGITAAAQTDILLVWT